MLNRSIASLLLVTAAACGTATSYLPTGTSPQPLESRDPSTVEVYADRTPTVPYVEVGLIEAHRRTRWSGATTLDIYAAMRDDAADQGCDAIIITGSHDIAVRNLAGHRDALEGYTASCVMYMPTARPSAGEGS